MADKLILSDHEDDQLRLFWWFEDEEDFGAALGDTPPERLPDDDESRDETIRAYRAAEQTAKVQKDERGFFWPTKTAGRQAEKAVNAVLADRSSVPWPEWAVKATAAGWKAPKGWTP